MANTRACLIFLAGLFVASIANANEIQGKVTHVRDADTIEVRGIPIRLDGVDAPDKGQSGYWEGKDWMKQNYSGRLVRCILTGKKTYDRWVGTCFGSKGENISVAVISAGWARDCPRFSGGRYRKYETRRSRSVPMKKYCR
ncbi:thermonuclease family protein [Aliiroseovarius sp. M344]|uniref:thermonuclease family protein n=1 Tax=Aliiroseovarius sp. M344 TaxID=2867010 RepID=UPI0021AD535C|nr:thermonuclease family protein [Aliiroseovarius sp. M344]UWQ14190.1 thermonuclease family protein [Aliiroseovarius sp. M344]